MTNETHSIINKKVTGLCSLKVGHTVYYDKEVKQIIILFSSGWLHPLLSVY